MVRLTKIYTRKGDGGTTRLVGGQEVAKDALRIEAYGTVDELNAVMGLVREGMRSSAGLAEDERDRLMRWVHDVQQSLFNLGSDLATRLEDRFEGQPVVGADDVASLERDIDGWNEALEPLKSFILPGGGPIAAPMHLARTVCRRAERRTIALGRQEPIGEHCVPYLNRLSDALFVLGRHVAKAAGEPEILWEY